MLMPKKDRKAVFTLLFSEGILVAKKDIHAPKHPQLDVPNLHVIKAMQGLKSKGYVKEQFCWKHYYWYLTNEGIQYLREYLHLPPEIVPATLKRTAAQRQGDIAARPITAATPGKPGDAVPLDRAGYRRDDKAAAVGSGAAAIGFVSLNIYAFPRNGEIAAYNGHIQTAPPFQQSAMRSASVGALNFPSEMHAQNQTESYPQQQFHQAPQPNGYQQPAIPSQRPRSMVPNEQNHPLMRGWLFHWEGWPLKFWHKRWAVLRPGALNIYKSTTSDKLLNSFLLHNYQITVSGREDKNYRRFAFRCESPGLKTLYFATESENDMHDWIKTLQGAIQPFGFYNGQTVEQVSGNVPAPISNEFPQNKHVSSYQNQLPAYGFSAENGNYQQPQQHQPMQQPQHLQMAQQQQHHHHQQQQQQQQPTVGYYYKQSPPLPPPVPFPPSAPQQQRYGLPEPSQLHQHQQPQNYENFEQSKLPSQVQEQKPVVVDPASASRQRYGAFIQQLDEERRRRSQSLIGLTDASNTNVAPVQPPHLQRNELPVQQQPNPYNSDSLAGRYGYNSVPSVAPQFVPDPSSRLSTAPLYTQPAVMPQELIVQSSWSQPSMQLPEIERIQQNQPLDVMDGRNNVHMQGVSITVPRSTANDTTMTYSKYDTYSPSINSSSILGGDMPRFGSQQGDIGAGLTQSASVTSLSSRSKIPSLQERMYSLMRCVNSDSNAPSASRPGSTNTSGNQQQQQQQPNSTTAKVERPSLSHWLVRDMATGCDENGRRLQDEDEHSGTLTPGATPSKEFTAPQRKSQLSPQYSQVVKKVPHQQSSMYVEHWLDAHATEQPPFSSNPAAVDGEQMSSPEPPRRVEDVFGKTRDELVLMLIQLRRRQAQGRYVDPTLYQIIEQQLAAERSVINLVDNVVAPYGTAESSTLRRQRNVERINSERAMVADQLAHEADPDFESKQAIFWRLDEAVNRQTEVVTSLQEQHQQLIDAINIIRSRMTSNSSLHQLTQLEASLHGIRASLSTASRHLESLIFQRNQLDKQLQEMKARQVTSAAFGAPPSRSLSVPSLQFIRPQPYQQHQLPQQPLQSQPVQQPQQQPSVQRYDRYAQPVVPVAPIQQRQQDERSAHVQSPVYATVRRYQSQKANNSSLLEPVITKSDGAVVEKERVFSYSGAASALTKPADVHATEEFKQPEPIYSRPLRFPPQSQRQQSLPPPQVQQQQQQPLQQQLPPPQNQQQVLPIQQKPNQAVVGTSRLASILQPSFVATNGQSSQIHPATSMSMLSDAGSEATIDSLARQYTGPFTSRQQNETENGLRQNGSYGGGDDAELVDMVQRALAVVGEPTENQQYVVQEERPRVSGVVTATPKQPAVPMVKNNDRPTYVHATSSSVPRRFSAHLRQPTPPPMEALHPQYSLQDDGLDLDDTLEPEQFERDVFGAPDKIEIPERYDPVADMEDTWTVDNESGAEREQRSDRYRQILLKQSLSNLTQEEAANLSKTTDLHTAIRQESVERDRLLRLSQAVAQQAKNASIHQAERLRRSNSAFQPSNTRRDVDLPPVGPPPPPPADDAHDKEESPTTLWMEFGNREMAIDVC